MSDQPAHTPGPWSWNEKADTLLNPHDVVVLAIDCPDFIDDRDKALIAAAPDLLAACTLALHAFECNDAIDWNELTLAIAKAEGR